MVELGKYAFSVLSAWGLAIGAILVLSLITWLQSGKARRGLQEAEARLQARKDAANKDG